METNLLAHGRGILSSQPFSASLGTQVEALVRGHAELSLEVSYSLLQQHGFVHGGVLAYLADNALTFAGGSVLGDSLTSEFKVNYLRPVRDATSLLAIADVTDSGARQAVCRCDVYFLKERERTLCAAAQGTIRRLG